MSTNNSNAVEKESDADGFGSLEKRKDETRYRTHKRDPENQLKSFDEFDEDFGLLYMNEPFLGQISAQITKVADPSCKTAYVGIRKNGATHEIIMGYSPKFFREHTPQQRAGIITHELYHFILMHIFGRSVSEKELHRMQNIAMDLSINSIIGEKNLPDVVMLPGKRPYKFEMDEKGNEVKTPDHSPYGDYIANAPPLLASDLYFEDLKKIYEEQKKQNGGDGALPIGLGTMDDHDGWSEIDPELEEQLRNRFGNIVENAMKEAQKSNRWGSIPQEMQEYLNKLFSKEVDWRSIIRNFVGRSRTLQRTSTVRRINKKMPYMFPGVKRPLVANFACFVDQSGSMSDEDIAQMFGELQNLASLTEIDVFHFDTEVDEKNKMKWRKGDANPKCLRTRCGGTDFDAVADFLNRRENRGRYSGALLLTDGYAPTMGIVQGGTKILWVITSSGTLESVRQGDLACQMNKDKGNFKKR